MNKNERRSVSAFFYTAFLYSWPKNGRKSEKVEKKDKTQNRISPFIINGFDYVV
jgi:hypothetical protein